MARVDDTVDDFVQGLSQEDVEYILANFGNYLQMDLKGPFNKRRTDELTSSPLDLEDLIK